MWNLHFLSHRPSLLSLQNFPARAKGFPLPSSLPSFFPRFFPFDHENLHFHMLLMEGNLGSETRRQPPPPVAGDTVCDHHLTRSNSDASSLTAENCKASFRGSKNVTLDECTAWTNEKHNSYLNHLEMSFVEQLYQSKSVLAQCSGQNLRDIHISRKQLINLNNASTQYNISHNGCWQKIKCTAGEPIPSSTSADFHASLESKRTHHSKHRGVHRHPSPAKMPTSLELIRTWKQGEEMISHGIQTCSQDLIDLTREGTGQNFLDELNSESQAKRLKKALGDGSLQDQVPVLSDCLPVNALHQSIQSSLALDV